MKLGRMPARRDPRTPSLGRYKRAMALSPPPPAVDWYSKVPSWPMMANDRLGDCTCAAVGHAIQQWTTYAGTPEILPDCDIVSLYSAVSGYDPADPSTDQGAVEMDVLEYWAKNVFNKDRLTAFAALNIGSRTELKDSIAWFGNAYIGINCPESALDNQNLWDVVPGSPIAGGHAVLLVGYDADMFFTVSWGKLIPTTAAFLGTYMEEAYGLIHPDFIDAAGTTPAGLNIAQLTADMAALRAGPP